MERVWRAVVFGHACRRQSTLLALLAWSLLVMMCRKAVGMSVIREGYWHDLVFHPNASAVDQLHGSESIRGYFTETELSALRKSVDRYLSYPNERLNQTIEEVSIKKPFIFFHQRKAGGTSIRQTLYDAAKILKLPSNILCFEADCDLYDIPTNKVYAVYAGHYKWGVQYALTRFGKNYRTSYSCATNFRHPIERIESCLYYRFGNQVRDRCLPDIPDVEFAALLHEPDYFGTSCLNEPFRALSGISDEVILDHLMDPLALDEEKGELSELSTVFDQMANKKFNGLNGNTKPSVTLNVSMPSITATKNGSLLDVNNRSLATSRDSRRRLTANTAALSAFDMTLDHLLHCQPIVLELSDSFDLLHTRIPLLGNVGAFRSDTKSNTNKKSCAKLSGARLQMVERHAALEMMLYDAVFRKTLSQISESIPNFLETLQCRETIHAIDYIPLQDVKAMPLALISPLTPRIMRVRQLIEATLGLYTGSFAAEQVSLGLFAAEKFCGKRMPVIYASPDATVMKVSSHLAKTNPHLKQVPAEIHYIWKASKKRCGRGMIPHLTNGVVVIDDPFVAMFHRWVEKGLIVVEAGKVTHVRESDILEWLRMQMPPTPMALYESMSSEISSHKKPSHNDLKVPLDFRRMNGNNSSPSPKVNIEEHEETSALEQLHPALMAVDDSRQLSEMSAEDIEFHNATALKANTTRPSAVGDFCHCFALLFPHATCALLFHEHNNVYKSFREDQSGASRTFRNISSFRDLFLTFTRGGAVDPLPQYPTELYKFVSYESIMIESFALGNATIASPKVSMDIFSSNSNNQSSTFNADKGLSSLLKAIGQPLTPERHARTACAHVSLQRQVDEVWVHEYHMLRSLLVEYPTVLLQTKALVEALLHELLLSKDQFSLLIDI